MRTLAKGVIVARTHKEVMAAYLREYDLMGLVNRIEELEAAAEWVDRYTWDMRNRGLTEIPDTAIEVLHELVQKNLTHHPAQLF